MESTGDIVFVGKEKEDDPPALHIYNYKNGWQKIRSIPVPCSHRELFNILPVMIENNEHLLVSCYVCDTIWFCDIDSGMFNEAFWGEGFYPGFMCKAEVDYVYINHNVNESDDILKVKCSPTGLTVDKRMTIQSNMDIFHSMCYLPDVNCIAFSWWGDRIVKVIHCETSEEVWEVKGEVAGVTWQPQGLLYSPEHQSLLVCDGNSRLVVLNPCDGSVLQIIPLSNLGLPVSLSVHKGNIILSQHLNYWGKYRCFRNYIDKTTNHTKHSIFLTCDFD